jgi:hypothetical protein
MMDDRASAQEESGEEKNLVEKLKTFKLSTKTPVRFNKFDSRVSGDDPSLQEKTSLNLKDIMKNHSVSKASIEEIFGAINNYLEDTNNGNFLSTCMILKRHK